MCINARTSRWFELEAEDEDNFAGSVKVGAVGYHPHQALNVQVAWAPLLWADQYDTYATTRLLTDRNRPQVINQSFGGADTPDGNQGRLRDQRQILSVYGRPLDRLFYSVGYAGITNDTDMCSKAAAGRRGFRCYATTATRRATARRNIMKRC